ncbi:MAG: type II toxin-antitoxin system CcdA family antitoxin [Magnetococcales bacterium]|nr:type II toxin-antitoxin system CcdA family antitoxin [Magnetococcales bacterium]
MDHTIYDASAPKKPVNVSVNSDLLTQAKTLKINLSKLLETHLVMEVTKQRREAWLKDNQEAIAQYNKRINQHGVFGDSVRLF